MKNRLDDLASIVNFGALSGFLFLHVSVLVRFGLRAAVARMGARTGWCRSAGIVVVLAVFSGMSALAVKVGSTWLIAGLLYGAVLKAKRRQELQVSL